MCYASTLKHERQKFDSRAQQCLFISYPFGIKGFKLYDLHTHDIFLSRDVFYEHIFPFSYVPSSSSPHTPLFSTSPLPLDDYPTSPSSHFPDLSTTSPDVPTADLIVVSPVVPTIVSPIVPIATSPSNCPTPVNFSYFSLVSSTPPTVISSPIRRSTCVRTQSSYLQDYHCGLISSQS